MKIKLIFILIAFSLMILPASAQITKVLEGDEVTEAALIEALAPERSIRTRSIKVFSADAEDTAQAEPVSTSASMLITFGTNSAELTANAMQQLDVLGRALKMDSLADFNFAIEGHTDPRGGESLNQQLSKARAEAVLNYLVWNYQISASRLTAVGKGSRELLNSDNRTAPENRRVTIVRKVD